MKQLLKLTGCLALAGLFASCQSAQQEANYQIIPMPQEIVTAQGNPFILKSGVKILYPEGNEKMQRNAQFLADYLKTATGKDFAIEAGTEGKNAIVLTLGTANENPESYQLKVTGDGITIASPTEAGVFYGIQSLRKSLPVAVGADISMPAVEINDAPRFGYRGAHFDTSRHFFTVDEVKTYIDMMALHNMNRFHWHITEDQGWRLEIKKYPKLTEIGSKRTETVIGRNSGEYDGKPYGGFYTQEQAKEIVAYAAERYITVIPEIDLPGHMQAALAAYPELGCTGGPYEVWRQWGVSEDVLCAGNDQVLKFLEDVYSELIEIFPSEYIHVGGDECPKVRWEKCPKCQARIKALGLKSDDKHSKEERLQSFVINHIEKFLNDHGRQIIGWDEILEGGLAPNATVMSWRGEKGGIEAAKQKHDVIMTPNTYLYFDYYQAKDVDNEPFGIGGYLPLERVYSYEPMPASLTPEEQKYIKGVQANLWTEYIATFPHAQYMVLPRWAALCEIQWSSPEKKNYADFLSRLPQLIKWYDAEGYNYAKHAFGVQAEFEPNPAEGTMDVTLSTIDNAPVHYTLDGTEPTTASPVYEGVLKIKENATLSAKAIRPTGESQTLTEKIDFSKSSMKPIVANQPINEQYLFKGASTLNDGLKGNSSYRSGRWIAFNGNDMDMTIDLQQPTEISSVAISVNIAKGDWVFDARNLSVEVSDDGKTFKKIASEEYPAMKETDKDGVVDHQLTFAPVTTQYVRVIASPEKTLPEWHGGKGKNAFLFVDEIKID
ncbi:glycoside hydrolase family 20 protein [Bacteroides sp. SL.2.06]|jgi:hexosaminidase|uniref:glycoside hydrolase family 20 protein n=1 Tax=Bacteroides TaxID=816 RepID=UPI000EBA965D|nr:MULTISPECIES: family 20 glycosylhydrolase [unclassified Bacteroides]MCQ4809464.1 glycoside hydrolase family 20 protein [Bacteroides sp. SL.2.06]MCS2981918.1 glycoside hydrolase family 20 protein [Bacteroides xylanisolvens]RJU32688.1 beta-N-acetylhexosaminidase [Bacteroides sp. AM54-2NS]